MCVERCRNQPFAESTGEFDSSRTWWRADLRCRLGNRDHSLAPTCATSSSGLPLVNIRLPKATGPVQKVGDGLLSGWRTSHIERQLRVESATSHPREADVQPSLGDLPNQQCRQCAEMRRSFLPLEFSGSPTWARTRDLRIPDSASLKNTSHSRYRVQDTRGPAGCASLRPPLMSSVGRQSRVLGDARANYAFRH